LEVDRNGEVTSIAVPTLGIYQLVVISTQASRR
jgi:hypothetical protein